MSTRHHAPPEQAIEELEHAHNIDVEAVTIQTRALGRAVMSLAAAIEALMPDEAGDVPAGVSEQLEQARWEIRNLW